LKTNDANSRDKRWIFTFGLCVRIAIELAMAGGWCLFALREKEKSTVSWLMIGDDLT